MSDLPPVVVGMSGGVDSSVAAALLVEQGYPVTGIMLRLWSEPGREADNRCCTPDDVAQARRVSAQLGIAFYVMDVREAFRQTVVQGFLDGYAAGTTPNPCLICNRQIRWGLLLDQVRAVGAEYLATGHYARTRRAATGKIELLRGIDEGKDQAYVLGMLNQQQLSRSLFPLGDMHKLEVRETARRFGLEVAERSESQDLCFLGKEDYRQFLARYAPGALRPGLIFDTKENLLGEHQGLALYTIGQRKGIGITSSEPYFVLRKDIENNSLIVGRADELGQSELIVRDCNWIAGEAPGCSFTAQVKIRYRATLVSASVQLLDDGSARLRFEQPLRDITPGQIAVLYQREVVLGGGMIQRAGIL